MKRIIMMVLRNIIFVPFGFIKLCWYAAHVDKYTDEQHFNLLRYIDKRAIKGGNIVIDAHGMEKIPKESGYIYYPNHQGLFDALAIIHVVPQPISLIGKIELKDIPFLKQVFAVSKSYAIDRDDLRQSMRVIQSVSKDVQNGRNFLIFPEGTRSRQGNKLIEFKGGSFKAATKAKCPIIPVALIDSYKAFDTKSISRITVQVHFLDPIYYDEYKDMKTTEIAEEVKHRIEAKIAEEGY